MRHPPDGTSPAGSAFSTGRTTPESDRQTGRPQTSDESPTAVTPRKARRPYGRRSGGVSRGPSTSPESYRADKHGGRAADAFSEPVQKRARPSNEGNSSLSAEATDRGIALRRDEGFSASRVTADTVE